MSTVPIICVDDVEKTSNLLQELFDWKSAHGGSHFEDLVNSSGRSVLWLHENSAHHARFKDVQEKTKGVGLSIYVLVSDIEETFLQTKSFKLEIVEELHLNTNAQFREFTF